MSFVNKICGMMKTVEFQRADGRTINIEIIKYAPGDSSRNKTPDRHRHNFHSIFFIQQGSSSQEIDFENYEISGNQVMVIPMGAIHWEKANTNLRGYVILFKDDFFSNPQKRLLNGFLQYAIVLRKLLIPIEVDQVDNIIRYFDLLNHEQTIEGNQNQTFILQNLMLALLNKLEGLILDSIKETSFIQTRGPFQRFVELVDTHYTEQKHLAFYTSELNITSRKLNDIMKRMTGQTATNFIIDRTLLEAKRELCFSEKSIKEIAYSLGYESQYYFSRIFKKRINTSPEQFRAAYAE